ncbi:MAG: UPF0280 family protein [Dehalococcoidia bacterium]|nr:UPF0280 family protein [Dehalococcoidia bacterium]
MYQPRHYRTWVKAGELVCYNVRIQESDLYIHTCCDLSAVAQEHLRLLRADLKSYIQTHPFFAASFEPLEVEDSAPPIIKLMAQAAKSASVGPMAAVAGAISDLMGQKLSAFSTEVIVENGGDNYICSLQERTAAIYAGNSPLSGKVGLRLKLSDLPLGICTSSATVGPSISFGKTDASVIVAKTAALADAAASAVGNAVSSQDGIQHGLEVAQSIMGILGAVIIVGDKIGVWGEFELCRCDFLADK